MSVLIGDNCVGSQGYQFLPGDVVECEIEKIGVLRNPVAVAGEAAAGSRVAAE